jgi:hypothetical protein
MTRSPTRRGLFFFAFVLSVPTFVLGCPKKPVPVADAGEPPPAPSASVTELAPLTDDDAGEAADADAGPKKWTGGGGTATNANQRKIQACCNAMRGQAKQLGPSPEAIQLVALAAQCDTFARQVGPAGAAPELNQLRAILRSAKLPAACQF